MENKLRYEAMPAGETANMRIKEHAVRKYPEANLDRSLQKLAGAVADRLHNKHMERICLMQLRGRMEKIDPRVLEAVADLLAIPKSEMDEIRQLNDAVSLSGHGRR